MERFRLPSRGHERHARDRVRGIGGPDSGDERPDPWMFWRRVHDFNMTVSDATSGLTFSGVNPFDVLLPPGATTTFNLGTFNRERTNVSSNLDPLAFTLQLMLTLPAVIGTGPSTLFTSSIHGTTPGGGGPVVVNFNNAWQHFTSPAGIFEIAILTDPELTKNNFAAVVGTVRNITLPDSRTTSVPEPATLLLVGVGLTACATPIRRR